MRTTTKAAHTPGPWEYKLDGNELVIEKPATHFPEWGGDGPGQSASPSVRVAIACKFSIEQHQRYANARLIAAAPEMLEALESCLASLQMESECEGCTVDPCTQCRAEAAIRKARGGK